MNPRDTVEAMLNGKRNSWYYTQSLYTDWNKKYSTHRVVPSTRHFSAITNNNFGTASALALIPTILCITIGVMLTVFVTWLAGLAFFIIAPMPLAAVLVRYFSGYPHKGSAPTRQDIDTAEDAFNKMPLDKQKEYAKYLEAVYAETVDAKQVVQLFNTCIDKDSIQKQLKDELQVQNDLRKLLGDSHA